MSDTVHTIALAALLHDIGKFMQRAELEKDYPEIKHNYAEFCPNERSYLHAAHAAHFIQHFVPDGLVVGDTENDPKSDIVGQASLGISAERCLNFPA